MSEKYNNDYDDSEMMTLDLDDGTKLECEVVAYFDADDKSYIALLPVEYPEGCDYEEDEVLLYRYHEISDDEFELDTIDDDDEFEAAADAFDELLDEMEFNSMPESD